MDPEHVAYWFFRLNGCLTTTNFVVHSGSRSQETDADILAVRFPHRRELAETGTAMQDHGLFHNSTMIDVVIAEVKASGPCRLNGPWTNPEKGNLQRLLCAVGALTESQMGEAAQHLYNRYRYEDAGACLRVRLLALGATRNPDLPSDVQITWDEVLGFIYDRFREY